MKNFYYIILIVILFSCRDEIGIDNSAPGHFDNHTHVTLLSNGFPTMKVPDDNLTSLEGIELGRKLFYDPILSSDKTMSCASCHQQNHGFAEPTAVSTGVDGIKGNRNASALINIGWQSSFFWDGRSRTLEQQALEPVPNPIEMHLEWPDAVSRLRSHATYPAEFEFVFGTKNITKEHVGMAIAQFERSLISDQSKFDRFLKGEVELDPMESAGFNLFFSEKAECFHCHGQPLFTDDELHNNGLDAVFTDIGLAEHTGRAQDYGMFRTPTLRNVEYTAPYMHDGRFNTLEEVVDFYSDSVKSSATVDPLMPNDNGGFRLKSLEKAQLVAFLKTLSDTSFINNEKFSSPFE